MNFSVRLTRIGFFSFVFIISVLVVALSVRSPALLALAGFLSTIFVLSFVLAMWNILPVRIYSGVKKITIKGPKCLLPLKIERPWGTSYWLSIHTPAGEGRIRTLRGRQTAYLEIVNPQAGFKPLVVRTDFPLRLFFVELVLPGLEVQVITPPANKEEKAWDQIAGLAEYQGREPWSRVDWKAWARHQRLLVRYTEPEEDPPSRPIFKTKKETREPSFLWAGLLAYLSVLWAGVPFLFKLPLWMVILSLGLLAYGPYRLLTGKGPFFSENVGVLLAGLFFLFAPPELSLNRLWDKLAALVLGLTLVKGLSPLRAYDILQIFVLSLLLLVLYATAGKAPFWAVFIPQTFLVLAGIFLLHFESLKRLPKVMLLGTYAVGLCVAMMIFYLSDFAPLIPQSGVSNVFDLHEAQHLNLSSHIIGRLSISKGTPPHPLYLRTIAYKHYYHGFWLRDETPITCPQTPLFEYRLELKEATPGIPYLGCPETIIAPKTRTLYREGTFFPAKKGEYILRAHQGLPLAPPQDFLQIPPDLKEELEGIAQPLKGEDLEATLLRLSDYFADFQYTLNPGPPRGDPVLYFLTQHKAGFCEHFASAATLLLRTLGIPARVVSGFVVGPKAPWGGYYPISASGAHTWVEFWDGQSWRIYDPSPAVFHAEAYWNVWLDLLDFVLEKKLHQAWKIFLPLGLLLLFVYGALRLQKGPQDPVLELLEFLAKKGEPRQPHETMTEYVARLCERFPHLSQELIKFLDTYHEVVFGEKGSSERLAEAVRKLKTLFRE